MLKYKALLCQEVRKIKDSDVMSFVKYALDNADKNFWTSPCSSSGKFHPPEDQGGGGLIRHLVKASAVTEQFSQRAQFTEYELDLARAATLLHDICKNGNPWGEKTDYSHGIIGAEYLQHFDLKDKTGKQIIVDAVRYHMAPWITILSPEKHALFFRKEGKEEKVFSINEMDRQIIEIKRGLMPHSIIEKCVQEADYWASRNSMSFYPGVNVDISQRHDSD